jgi:hypothetical protein
MASKNNIMIQPERRNAVSEYSKPENSFDNLRGIVANSLRWAYKEAAELPRKYSVHPPKDSPQIERRHKSDAIGELVFLEFLPHVNGGVSRESQFPGFLIVIRLHHRFIRLVPYQTFQESLVTRSIEQN